MPINVRRPFFRSRLLAALAAGAVSMAFAAAAEASYPGQNGNLVYENYETLGDPTLDPFVVEPNNPASSHRLTKIGADAFNFEYSPNGKQIAFEATVPDSQIFVMDAKGRKAFSVTKHVKACNGETFPTWSPDGKQIAFHCARAEGFIEHDIYSVKLAKKKKGKGKRKKTVLVGKGQKRVTDTTDAYHPYWSPRGDRIAYMTYGGSIMSVPAGGGQETEIAASDSEPGVGSQWTGLDWSPDGSTWVVDGTFGIYLMDPNTGALLTPTPLLPNVTESVFSPDGTEIAFTTLTNDRDIQAINLATRNVRPITSEPGSERTPSWQPK